MTIGVGGSTPTTALATLSNMTDGVVPIAEAEYCQRIAAAQQRMREQGIAAMWAHAGTNMTYFTATQLPNKRGDWTLELSPMTRINAWKVAEPKVGDTIEAVGYTFKNQQGASIARVEYLIVGAKLYGLRSMPT